MAAPLASEGGDHRGVTGDVGGIPVSLNFGDIEAEYRAVRESAGVAERLDLAHLILRGRDPVRMVQGLITNDLVGATEDRVVYGAMLTPKGRVIAELRAGKISGPDGPEVWIDLPREVLSATTDHLRRSIPPMYARWRDASTDMGTLGVYGPRSRELLDTVLERSSPQLAEDERASGAFNGVAVQLIGTRYAGDEQGIDVVGSAEILPSLRDALLTAGEGIGVRRVGFAALEMLRIEAGWPRGGHELTEETIPTEAFESTGMMERAISFGKGCYTGQEVIVRIAHRGHVNRHLRGLILESDLPLPAKGTPIFHPQTAKNVGWTTSATHSLRVGGPIALAFVRREVEPGQRVCIANPDGASVEVTTLPFRATG